MRSVNPSFPTHCYPLLIVLLAALTITCGRSTAGLKERISQVETELARKNDTLLDLLELEATSTLTSLEEERRTATLRSIEQLERELKQLTAKLADIEGRETPAPD